MITRVQALRYRCFHQLDARWQSYNVLTGATGSGKSTLLDIPQLFGDLLTYGVSAAFYATSPVFGTPRVRDPRELIHCQSGDDFGLIIEAQLPRPLSAYLADRAAGETSNEKRRWPYTLRYEVQFEVVDRSVRVKEEVLWLIPKRGRKAEKEFQIGEQRPEAWRYLIRREVGKFAGVRPLDGWENQGRGSGDLVLLSDPGPDTLLLNTCALWHPAMNWLSHFLTHGVLFYFPDLPGMHYACPPDEENTRSMRSDAINLPWMVRKLQEEKPEMFAMWVEHIRVTLPPIVTIDTYIDRDDSSASLQVEYQGGHTLTSAGLSNGTLAMLALTILPYLTDLPELVCLREPENSVHLHRIETILQSLRALYNSQVWVSTHSPMILAHTEAKSIILMRDVGNNAIEAVNGSQYPRLRLWQSRINQSAYLLTDVLD